MLRLVITLSLVLSCAVSAAESDLVATDWLSIKGLWTTPSSDSEMKQHTLEFLESAAVQLTDRRPLSQLETKELRQLALKSIPPAFLDTLFDQLVKGFKFPHYKKVGCYGFLCKNPIYSMEMYDIQDWYNQQDWQMLSAQNNDQDTRRAFYQTKEFADRIHLHQRAYKAYILIESFYNLSLGGAAWGPNADNYRHILIAVRRTLNKSWPASTGTTEMDEAVRLLDYVNSKK